MSKVDQVIAVGEAERGKPYVFGDEGPNGFDCSGLTQFIFAHVGIKLPRTADQQYRFAKPVNSPSPGDLVFWLDRSGHASHVALYIGGGQVLAAPHTGAVVRNQPIFQESGHTRVYGRVPGLGVVGGTIATVAAPIAGVGGAVAGWTADQISGVLGGAKAITLEALAALAGAALVGLGAYRLAAPKIKATRQELENSL